MATERVSLWAMPSADDAWCRAALRRASALAGSPGFAAHVTLVGEVPRGWSPGGVAAALAGLGPVRARILGVEHEPATYRCVTLRVDAAALVVLRAQLLAATDRTDDAAYRPHLSLCYGELADTARRDVVAGTDLPDPLPDLVLDAVAAWDTGPSRWSEWRELERWPLAGAPS